MNRRDLFKTAVVLAAGSALSVRVKPSLIIESGRTELGKYVYVNRRLDNDALVSFTRASTAHYWQGDQLWGCGPDGNIRIA